MMPKITSMIPGITIATDPIKMNHFSEDKNAMFTKTVISRQKLKRIDSLGKSIFTRFFNPNFKRIFYV